MPGGRQTRPSPDADTVIAVAAPMRRAYGSQPSMRLLGMLMTVLLALWIARLGAAPLFDVDEGAFAEATRELTVGHDWGSTTLNGVDRFDKPILIYWFQAISLKTFGLNEFAVRLPSALCAFLWCLAHRPVRVAPLRAAGGHRRRRHPRHQPRADADRPRGHGRLAAEPAAHLATLDLWRHLENGRDWPRRRAFAWIGLGLLAKGPVALLIPAAAAGLWLADQPRPLAPAAPGERPGGLGADGGHRRALVHLRASPATAWPSSTASCCTTTCERFTGSLEGHAGSLFYYLEVLPAAMMPWTPLLVPIALHAARALARAARPLHAAVAGLRGGVLLAVGHQAAALRAVRLHAADAAGGAGAGRAPSCRCASRCA